jgi:hypothetical protein
MAENTGTAHLNEELELVEGQITELQATVDQLRADMGESWNVPTDGPERAQLLVSMQEQDALLQNMMNRREVLRSRLAAQ